MRASGDGGADGLGLLVHLLDHEVLVAALLGGLDGPVDGVHRPLSGCAVKAGDANVVAIEVGHVTLLEEDDPTGVGEHGGHVRGQQVLALTEAHDERHVAARAHQPQRLPPVQHGYRVGPVGLPQRGPHGVGDVAAIGLLDEVREDLRVGLGVEVVAAGQQAIAQLAVVLDDAVVDDRDVTGAIDVGMRVEVVGPSVGGPAGVGQADRGGGCRVEQRGAQVGQLAGALLPRTSRRRR